MGLVRSRNEDAWGEAESRIFAVADGMGGTAGGMRAAGLAITGFLTMDPSNGWLAAISHINVGVRRVCTAEGFPQAGSTLVGLVIDGPRCITISVGDSRIYRFRGGRLDLVTCDHNVRGLRIEEGLNPDEADCRGKPAALTSYLGNPDQRQRIDVTTIGAESGDRLLLCSDGVHGQLSSEALTSVLAAPTDPRLAAEHVVLAANQAGGRDNSTAVVVDLEVDEP